jgi:uncharacterized membrane protein
LIYSPFDNSVHFYNSVHFDNSAYFDNSDHFENPYTLHHSLDASSSKDDDDNSIIIIIIIVVVVSVVIATLIIAYFIYRRHNNEKSESTPTVEAIVPAMVVIPQNVNITQENPLWNYQGNGESDDPFQNGFDEEVSNNED